MAPSIAVESKGRHGGELRFAVVVREGATETRHDVTLAERDFEQWSRPAETGERFVERCFRFLLEREPKESILRSFDVRVIERYFPEFDAAIRG